ncbi:MAG: PTS sugar transporter subunit IIA [Betaproteobacteria bacterium]|nr:PTS sugar transporter subunit IIA [Betaproteobacteria bacterium]
MLVNLDVSSKKRLFEHIGLIVENERRIPRAAVFDALMARERLGSTGLGLGVAIPHGRIRQLRDVIAIFVRPTVAIPFDAPDGQPVELVFAMLVPEHANEQHLSLLSELAQMFGDDAFRETLLRAPDAPALHALLSQWTPYAEPERPATV